MKTIKVHLDTDLGGDIDDICALAFLLRSNVELTGVTVVGDTNGKRTGYTKYALKLDGKEDIPVAAGADVAGGFYRMELGLPQEDRYWLEPVAPSPNPIDEAIELLKNSIEQEAIVIGIGPYTNLFLLDRKYPGVLKQAKIFLMGGYIYPTREGSPDWGNNMDFNIQVDIKSAKHVLENSNPTLVPLSVTVETFLRKEHLDKLRTAGVLGKLLAKQAESFAEDEKMEKRFGRPCDGLPKDFINFQHDPLTCAIALGWNEGIEIKEIPLVIEEKDSWLCERIDKSGKLTKVVTKIDGPRFSEFWLQRITGKEFAVKEKLVMPEADPPLAENRPFRFRFPPTHRFGRAGKARRAPHKSLRDYAG
jgi:inosine-uridine nucleoside N-ribohydrolase